MTDVVIESVHLIARKRHLCDNCLQDIRPGTRYLRIRGVWDSTPGVFRSHEDCADAHHDLRHRHDLKWDEVSQLSNDFDRRDHAWVLETYPGVAERLGIAAWARPEYPVMTIFPA